MLPHGTWLVIVSVAQPDSLSPPAGLTAPQSTQATGALDRELIGFRQLLVTIRIPTAQSANCRNRSEFAITETELKLMAAAAIMGLKSRPKTGYATPAAIGTPSAL
jgi:hypothetical protein